MATSDITTSEVWRPVFGYEGAYEVSSSGRVKRLAGNHKHNLPERILLADPKAAKYKAVGLYKNGVRISVKVHVLVARAFLGECPMGYEVNHIDTDKFNNAVTNLEYVTHQQNMDHARHNKLRVGRPPKPRKKLTL